MAHNKHQNTVFFLKKHRIDRLFHILLGLIFLLKIILDFLLNKFFRLIRVRFFFLLNFLLLLFLNFLLFVLKLLLHGRLNDNRIFCWFFGFLLLNFLLFFLEFLLRKCRLLKFLLNFFLNFLHRLLRIGFFFFLNFRVFQLLLLGRQRRGGGW